MTSETITRLKSSAKSVFHFEARANNLEPERYINVEPSQPFLINHLIPGTSKEVINKNETIVKPQTLDNFAGVSINSSELASFQKLDQNIIFQIENVISHEDSPPKDLISQLKTQLPDNHFIIDEYASYLNF